MTKIQTSRDHAGPVRYTDPRIRFDATHIASVKHELAADLVAAHDEVSYLYPVPTEYDALREVAAALPTDRIDGNDRANKIVSFLEQFDTDEIERLCDDPSLLEVEVENRREKYSVSEPKDSGTEPEDPGNDDDDDGVERPDEEETDGA